MHAYMTYFIYSSNNLTLESIISQKYTDVQENAKVDSSQIHCSNSKCIEANNTANTQLLFLLRKHTNTQLVSLLQSIQKYLQAKLDVGLSFSIQIQNSNAEEQNTSPFSDLPI